MDIDETDKGDPQNKVADLDLGVLVPLDLSVFFSFYDFLSFLGHLNNAWPPGPWSHAPFWVILGTLFAILGPSGHSGAFRVLLAISGYVGHFGLFWAILGHSGPSGPFWALWALLAILGLWAILGNIGYSGPF